MKKTYNKLVRDRIPEIIQAQGREPLYRELSEEEYFAELKRKLQEELYEFLEADDPAELADLFEVADAIAEALGGKDKIQDLQSRKRKTNGGFERRLYLEAVLSKE